MIEYVTCSIYRLQLNINIYKLNDDSLTHDYLHIISVEKKNLNTHTHTHTRQLLTDLQLDI